MPMGLSCGSENTNFWYYVFPRNYFVVNTMRAFFTVGLVLLLGACVAPEPVVTMEKSDLEARHYVLSENYANHRLQQQLFET